MLEIKDKQGFKKLAEFLGNKTDIEAFPHHYKTELLPEKNVGNSEATHPGTDC